VANKILEKMNAVEIFLDTTDAGCANKHHQKYTNGKKRSIM
jgi:hypothetical protein